MRDAQLTAVEELMDVECAMARLTPRQREVLLLTVMGWTQEEIAEELGIARETVKTHLARARGQMAEACHQNNEPGICSQ